MLDVIFASAIRYSASFFSLLTSLLLANALGAEEFGIISFIIFSCTAFSAICSFSIQRTILITYAKKREPIISGVFCNYLIIIFISSVVSFFCAKFKYDITISLSCAMLVAGLQWQLFSSSLVSINDDYTIKKNQIFFFISRFSCFIFLYLSSITLNDFKVYLLIYSFFVFLPFILEFKIVYAKYMCEKIRCNLGIIKEMKQAKWMHVDTIFSQFIIFSSSFVFSRYGEADELGVYNLSQQIVTSSLLIVSVFQVYVSRLIKDNVSRDNVFSVIRKISYLVVMYSFIMMILSFALYKYYYLIGVGFQSIYIYVALMSFAGLFSIFNKIMIPIFTRLSMTRFVSITTVFSGTLGLFSAFLLISLYGGWGAALSFVLGYFISFVVFSFKLIGIYKYEK